MKRSRRSTLSGPGSRGGTYHLPGVRAAYGRAWVAAHPLYRERERLRLLRRRAIARGEDPSLVFLPVRVLGSLPLAASLCLCPCGCREEVVVECGMCAQGLHPEEGD